MRARLLVLPFFSALPAHGRSRDIDGAASGQVQSPHLDQLPMDGGWTYGELLDKA